MVWVVLTALVLWGLLTLVLLVRINDTGRAYTHLNIEALPGKRVLRLSLRNMSLAVYRWQVLTGIVMLLMGAWGHASGATPGAFALIGLGGGMWWLHRFVERRMGAPRIPGPFLFD